MKKNGKKEPLAPGEKRRLRQLVVCLVLFGIVFLGRGVDLAPIDRLAGQAAQLVGRDTDFQAVFAQVGRTVERGEVWLKDLLPGEKEGEDPAGGDGEGP